MSGPIVNGVMTQQSKLTFSPGKAGDIVLVRAFYQWRLFTPLLDGMAATLNGGSTLITATSVFRNEPYAVSSS